MLVYKVLSQTLKTHFSEWQRLFSHFYILLVLMKNDKLLVPNMFSVPILKLIFSSLPLDYFIFVCVFLDLNDNFTDFFKQPFFEILDQKSQISVQRPIK